MTSSFHCISSIKPLLDMQLLILFSDGTAKIYDVKPLESKFPVFRKLEDRSLFDEVDVGEGGYGAVWNDETDISSEELWEHGIKARRLRQH